MTKHLSLAVLLLLSSGFAFGEISPTAQLTGPNGRKIEILSVAGKDAREPSERYLFVIYPKHELKAGEKAPLYVCLHAWGGNAFRIIRDKAAYQKNHIGIYDVPDDFFGFVVDGDGLGLNWWGGPMGFRGLPNEQPGKGSHEMSAGEKTFFADLKWLMTRYPVDDNRVYMGGNSMGGSGSMGLGLNHGDIFAAIKLNVPAGVEHAALRMYFPPDEIPDGVVIPDPPICVDYSAQNDQWSGRHEVLYNAMRARHYMIFGYWGPFGHAGDDRQIVQVNDLVHTFDWTSVRKNEAYPVFTNASSDNPIPWPEHYKDVKDKKAGQVNAFFRWKNLTDTKDRFEISLFLLTPETLKTFFTIPPESTADVTLRRIQKFESAPGKTINWSFGKTSGKATADQYGKFTIEKLTVTGKPETLSLTQ